MEEEGEGEISVMAVMVVVACRRGLARPKAADKWGTITRAALSSDEEEERILW